MDEQTFWANSKPDTALEKVKSELPTLSRADQFLLETKELATAAQQSLATAQGFVVDTESALQVADMAAASLKDQKKTLKEQRLNLTRPIDDWKQVFVDAEASVTGPCDSAIKLYENKMSAFLREKREETARKQREAERLLAEQKAKQEAEARKLEEKAAKLKTDSAKQKALAEAENIRNVAALTPTSIAIAPAPATVASNVAELWELDRVENMAEFLRWLADHPEWHGVINLKTSEINRMARQFRDVVQVPGVRFHTKDSFRSKASR